jgi:hypothetical protein
MLQKTQQLLKHCQLGSLPYSAPLIRNPLYMYKSWELVSRGLLLPSVYMYKNFSALCTSCKAGNWGPRRKSPMLLLQVHSKARCWLAASLMLRHTAALLGVLTGRSGRWRTWPGSQEHPRRWTEPARRSLQHSGHNTGECNTNNGITAACTVRGNACSHHTAQHEHAMQNTPAAEHLPRPMAIADQCSTQQYTAGAGAAQEHGSE